MTGTSPPKHARLAASKTKQWAACPGSLALEEAFPQPDISGEAAMLGTAAHALIEECLGKGHNPADYAGREIFVDEDDGAYIVPKRQSKKPKTEGLIFEVDDDIVDATTKCVEYVRERLVALFPGKYKDADDPSITKKAVEAKELYLESRVNPLPERDDTGGTADITIVAWPDTIEVIDYKNGSSVWVPVKDNWQGRTYLLGRLQDVGFDFEVMRVSICQPRHHQAPPSGVTWEEYTEEDMQAFFTELREAAHRVDKARKVAEKDKKHGIEQTMGLLHKNGYIDTGKDGDHCTWCRYLKDCPAAHQRVQQMAAADFADEPMDVSEREFSPAIFEQILPWVPFIKRFCKHVEEQAEQHLLDGGQITGYKMVQKQGNRTWHAEATLADIKKRAKYYGLTADDFTREPGLKTGPQVLAKVDKTKKSEFEKEFIVRPSGAPTMVSDADSRPSIRGAEEDFADDG